MDTLQSFLPLLGVILGSSLSWIGYHFKDRSDRKKAISSALSDLLEIRHRFNTINSYTRLLRNVIPISPNEIVQLRSKLNEMIPEGEDIHKRYDLAVSKIAEVDPILGFKLRSKNSIPTLLLKLSDEAKQTGLSDEFEAFDKFLQSKIIPALDETLLLLAKQHSMYTSKEIKSLITDSNVSDEDIRDFLAEANINISNKP